MFKDKIAEFKEKINLLDKERKKSIFLLTIELVSLFLFLFSFNRPGNSFLASIISPIPDFLLMQKNTSKEVFGFAPHWKIDNLDNVDFSTLTTLAYFGVPLNGDGSLDKTDPGYSTLGSDKATQIFAKAHRYGTRVVLTITQMENGPIVELLDDPGAQNNAVENIVSEVKERGLDGVNIDMEYSGDPGSGYREKFVNFVSKLNQKLHKEIPQSKLTVSVYAVSVKDGKLYDIGQLNKVSDGIFMMAYDFAVRGSENAIPTAPLYGHKEGKYWYDVSSAVEDFLKVMPADKLILGVPWYGYDYSVDQPGVNVATNKGYSYWYKQWISPWYWVWRKAYYAPPSIVQTYSTSINDIKADKTGWDNLGKVGWKAYKDDSGAWRMFFMEDSRSLSEKYNFAKSKNLGGVGIWALGFDEGKSDMWTLLRQKFGNKLAQGGLPERNIQ